MPTSHSADRQDAHDDSSQIFDRDELLSSISGDQDLLEQFIHLFHTDFPGKIEAIRAAAPSEDGTFSGDVGELRNAAHKILGSARTMRLKRLATAAEDLHRTIDAGAYQAEDLKTGAARVLEAYSQVVALLNR